MKIACLQLEPSIGEVQRNIDHATKMIESLSPEDVDILVLPEMAFSGYVFSSKDHIRPYLEDAESGPTVVWAKQQAVRLKAFVQVGYPEIRIATGENGESIEKYYNSLCFVSPDGNLLTTYSKHFLYYTDEIWAEEGPSFISTPVESLGQVGFGICMDVNPYQFKANFSEFEFSNFHLKNKSNLILCSMAWNAGEESPKKDDIEQAEAPIKSNTKTLTGDDSDDDDEWEDEDEEDLKASKVQFDTIQYWALRMSPFFSQTKTPFTESTIVIANRIGKEVTSRFVGSSCVLKLRSTGPTLVDALPANKEGILLVEV